MLGEGSEQNPYIIENIQDLQDINNDLSAYYKLGNDIDASDTINWNGGKGFVPIGDRDNPFIGNFNGDNYVITDLYINRPTTDSVGLFGFVESNNSIINVGVFCDIKGNGYVGGLIGEAYNLSVFGCFASVIINAYNDSQSRCGGLIGDSYNVNVDECYTIGDVTGYGLVNGGFVGFTEESTFNNCYSCVDIITPNNSDYVGGFVGYNGFYSSFCNNCYSVGVVPDNGSNCNGFSNKEATNCYWDKEVSGIDSSSSGIGLTTSEMKDSSNFVNWDFVSIWEEDISNVNDGYHILQVLNYDELDGELIDVQVEKEKFCVDVIDIKNKLEERLNIFNLKVSLKGKVGVVVRDVVYNINGDVKLERVFSSLMVNDKLINLNSLYFKNFILSQLEINSIENIEVNSLIDNKIIGLFDICDKYKVKFKEVLEKKRSFSSSLCKRYILNIGYMLDNVLGNIIIEEKRIDVIFDRLFQGIYSKLVSENNIIEIGVESLLFNRFSKLNVRGLKERVFLIGKGEVMVGDNIINCDLVGLEFDFINNNYTYKKFIGLVGRVSWGIEDVLVRTEVLPLVNINKIKFDRVMPVFDMKLQVDINYVVGLGRCDLIETGINVYSKINKENFNVKFLKLILNSYISSKLVAMEFDVSNVNNEVKSYVNENLFYFSGKGNIELGCVDGGIQEFNINVLNLIEKGFNCKFYCSLNILKSGRLESYINRRGGDNVNIIKGCSIKNRRW